MAVELGPFGIRTNVLAPGPIEGTVGMDKLSTEATKGDGAARAIPLGRYGTKQDIANVTVFLFSDAAAFITGTQVVVDGGAVRYPYC